MHKKFRCPVKVILLTRFKASSLLILMHRCEWNSSAVLAVHNLADRPARVRLDLNVREGEYLTELLGDNAYERIERPVEVELPGYGYRWFRLGGGGWKLPY